MKYRTLGIFSNETEKDMTIFLEMLCEEIILSPGHEIELLAEDIEEAFPVSILYHNDGLQIYPSHGVPKWLIRFQGKEIVPSYPTRLSEHESK